MIKKGKLILEDGTIFEGKIFGAPHSSAGEVVFHTAVTGYIESISDPSYAGQILVLTYPLIGNYGVPAFNRSDSLPDFFESNKVQPSGLIVADYSIEYSHWRAEKSLSDWLKEFNVPGLYDIDTRALTQILRNKGAMLGKIVIDEDVDFFDPDKVNLVEKVTVKQTEIIGTGDLKVVLIDLGTKNNIIRSLIQRGVQVIRVPWDHDFNDIDFDGLLVSNGPGNPKRCEITIQNLKKAFKKEKPIFGICLGNQLMALAAGADTFKMKYGHRSHNQPVLIKGTDKAYITSQNHGYAVDNSTLPATWEPYFINLNDDTNEGLKHISLPFFSVQFHPEAASGPTDTEFLFDQFIDNIKASKL